MSWVLAKSVWSKRKVSLHPNLPVSSIKIATQALLFDVGLKNRVDYIALVSKGILSTMTEILVCMLVEESILVAE
jgi:hypothetical protein